MKKITVAVIIIIIIGVCLALAGFAAGGLQGAWIDRGGIHLANAENGNLVTVDKSYKSLKDIVVNADLMSSITFKEGDSYSVRGQNYERYGGLNVRLSGDTLYIDATRSHKWLNFDIGIKNLVNGDADSSWLEITYPKGAKLGNVHVDLGTGSVSASDIDCDELYLEDSFGKINASTVSCGKLTVKAASGDVQLSGLDVSGSASVNDSFGNVNITGASADSLTVDLSAGNASISDVTARTADISNNLGRIGLNNLTADSLGLKLSSGDLNADSITTNDLSAESSLGKISIDRLVLNGSGLIKQSSGDVSVNLDMNESDLSYELDTNTGSVNVDGRSFGSYMSNNSTGAGASLTVNSSLGNITLRFMQ